jgi:SAM-dependent methyltransferase
VTFWAAGRYDALGDRIAGIAHEVVAAAARRTALRDAAVVDLACGTGSAALAAAATGAVVTGADITPELMAIGAQKAARKGLRPITWVTADAADTGLPSESFDAAVSNMGIIFVEPSGQVAELNRLLKPGGVLCFSSWVHAAANPLFDPVVEVVGLPPATGFTPDQWGDPDVVTARLAAGFDAIEIETGMLTWEFDSLRSALHFLSEESPTHVDIFRRADPMQREQLAAAFESALGRYVDRSGVVGFDSPYAVVSALRR